MSTAARSPRHRRGARQQQPPPGRERARPRSAATDAARYSSAADAASGTTSTRSRRSGVAAASARSRAPPSSTCGVAPHSESTAAHQVRRSRVGGSRAPWESDILGSRRRFDALRAAHMHIYRPSAVIEVSTPAGRHDAVEAPSRPKSTSRGLEMVVVMGWSPKTAPLTRLRSAQLEAYAGEDRSRIYLVQWHTLRPCPCFL